MYNTVFVFICVEGVCIGARDILALLHSTVPHFAVEILSTPALWDLHVGRSHLTSAWEDTGLLLSAPAT